jgi:DNA-binding NtrC family response regulator
MSKRHSNVSPPDRNTVLVVDDSEPWRRICRIALVRHGYRVEIADGAKQAIAALSSVQPDFLLCDLLLGASGSGFEVLQAAHKIADRAFCIGVTGFVTPDIRRSALEAGFDAFLFKPYSVDKVCELFQRATKTSR